VAELFTASHAYVAADMFSGNVSGFRKGPLTSTGFRTDAPELHKLVSARKVSRHQTFSAAGSLLPIANMNFDQKQTEAPNGSLRCLSYCYYR
jgi:hypothetical protein